MGLGYAYVLIDFDQLGARRRRSRRSDRGGAQAAGFAGLNVTHPFKQAVIPHLDDLSPEAAAIGAVNTVLLRTGGAIGHNTDSWGFAESFRENARRRARPAASCSSAPAGQGRRWRMRC